MTSHPHLATVADALHVLDEATRTIIASEAAQVLAIAAACDLHKIDETVLFEGAERWLPGGADGTPDIGEFIALEIGIVLGISPGSAVNRIANVLNVRHRHPRLWQAVCEGDVRFYEAARVAETCALAGLDANACAIVDQHCANALLLQPWTRVRNQIDGWIILADPKAAAERSATAANARSVKVSQIKDGHCDLWGRLDASDGIALDHALSSIAKTMPTNIDLDIRRATAVGVLARQALGQAQLPRTAEIIIRLDATTTPDGEPALAEAATVQGWGPVLTHQLRGLLDGCKVTVRPILDAHTMTPSDAYQLPPTMKRIIHERWPSTRSPTAPAAPTLARTTTRLRSTTRPRQVTGKPIPTSWHP